MQTGFNCHTIKTVFPAILIGFIVGLLLMFGFPESGVLCFGVDSGDRLYVGCRDGIHVLEDGEEVAKLDAHTSRSYYFTILSDDTILLATTSSDYLMERDGTVHKQVPASQTDTNNILMYRHNRCTSVNQDVYEMTEFFGWAQIRKNQDQVVFQSSILKLLMMVVWGLSMVWLAYFACYYLVTSHAPKSETKFCVHFFRIVGIALLVAALLAISFGGYNWLIGKLGKQMELTIQ